MLNRSITSLAILKANWDIRHFDYMDNFVPFFQNLIKIKNYKEINVDTIREDFEKEFGLSIPYHPILAILTRLKSNGLIYKQQSKFLVDQTKKQDGNFDLVSAEQERKLNKLVDSLINFSKNTQDQELDKITAEKALLGFFRENEISLLFATKEESLIPEVVFNKSVKYIVAKFIQNAKDADPDTYNFLVEIAVGTALATTMVYGEHLKNFSGRSKDLNLYFDTGYIFALLGVNGEEKRQAFEELTQTLVADGAKTFIFEHTYDEVMGILTSALHWINQGDYDIQKASRVLKYFLANSFTETDVEMFITQVPIILDQYKVQKAQKPSYSQDIIYQIDEAELKEQIVNSYKNDPFFDENHRDETINKDITSIYSICKLRKGKIAYTLKDASHVFITTNTALARISTKVQRADNVYFSIPPSITDVFIGTLVWLQNPVKTKILNEKKLMADAYAAIQPDSQLIKKYIDEVEALKVKGNISDNEYFILRTNRVSFRLLSEKTKNDVNNFQPKTTTEILNEINEKHLADLKEQLENQIKISTENYQQLETHKQLLDQKDKESNNINLKYEKTINLFAGFVTWLLLPIITTVVILALLINSFPSYSNNLTLQILAFVVICFISLAGVSVLNIKKWLFIRIKDILTKFVNQN